MSGAEWMLELVLMALLVATLFHALRLERALGVLKRDRAALAELIEGFNASTRHAEAGIHRLRETADGTGRQIARQAETAAALKDDLLFLMERGTNLADRLDALVRSGRPLAPETAWPGPPHQPRLAAVTPHEPPSAAQLDPSPRVRSQAERDLLHALRAAR